MTVIQNGSVYSLKQFYEITGLKGTAVRSIDKKAREKQITIIRHVSNRGFVRGDDFNAYLATVD